MRDVETFKLNDACMKCRLQRSNAIRRPRNRKIFDNRSNEHNVFILDEDDENRALLSSEIYSAIKEENK